MSAAELRPVPVPRNRSQSSDAVRLKPALSGPAADRIFSQRISNLLERVDIIQSKTEAALRGVPVRRLRRGSLRDGRRGINTGRVRYTVRMKCPLCRSRIIERSRRRNELEHLMSLFVLPFRCCECRTRFFVTRIACY